MACPSCKAVKPYRRHQGEISWEDGMSEDFSRRKALSLFGTSGLGLGILSND
jgi:hypothetical protein